MTELTINEAKLKFPNVIFKDRHQGEGKLFLGEGVGIAAGTRIDLTADVYVGDGTYVCEDCKIFTHRHDRVRQGDFKHMVATPLTIGDNCFIGEGTRIMGGTQRIGHKSVIGNCCIIERPVNEGAFIKAAANQIIVGGEY